ncbi:MAG: glycerol-3-phosphate 1-O-acyltransferase PlsY [Bacteroidales bacterium]|nr:glycerol-3-phosphate 1-O-acyltransferase PlsY [Bacteroidales bacterium]
MPELNLIMLAIAAYLLGSIPTAVWVGKTFYNLDVRTQGSGNAGATNTIRVLGWKAGVPVLLFDVFKSWLAVKLPIIFSTGLEGNMLINFQLLLGAIAVTGHIFPVFAGFKGGKGVASITGIVIALFPATFFIVMGIFTLILLLSGYVSLASILSAITFPFIAIFVIRVDHPALMVFSILVGLVVPLMHRKNIKRLLNGTESKFIYRNKS